MEKRWKKMMVNGPRCPKSSCDREWQQRGEPGWDRCPGGRHDQGGGVPKRLNSTASVCFVALLGFLFLFFCWSVYWKVCLLSNDCFLQHGRMDLRDVRTFWSWGGWNMAWLVEQQGFDQKGIRKDHQAARHLLWRVGDSYASDLRMDGDDGDDWVEKDQRSQH